MDNLCHTLAGLAFGEAGLKRRARFGNATLMIASNLPDVDVLVFATDVPAVAFRRGWTHGVLAQVLLPIALAAIMAWVSGRRRADGLRSLLPLLLLCYIGVLSHVFLDVLNNYGVRLLMPFSGRWFYGDSVFIVDIWLWLTLGLGVWLARSRERSWPARAALMAATVYIGAMVVSARSARDVVGQQWRAAHGVDPQALMVGPMPVTPFHRAVIVDAGESYSTGTFTWFQHRVTFDPGTVPKNDDHPAVRAALSTDRRFRAVLVWSRFPFYEIEAVAEVALVTLRDLRFGDQVGGVRAVVGASRDSSRPAGPSP